MRLKDACNSRLLCLVVMVVPDRVGGDSMAMRFVDVEADVEAVLFCWEGMGWRL